MKNLLIALYALCVVGVSHAQDSAIDADAEQKIRSSLAVLLPGLRPDSIRPTPLAGFYEVAFGMRLVYVTADGRFLLQGKLVDLETRTEITNERLAELKTAAMAGVGEDNMVIYGPQDAKHTVTVFTDIDCGFCRKLHSEMNQYVDNGIRVRYLFYPRAGIGSESYDKAVSVWCADDRRTAMDAAKAGQAVPAKVCANPVADHHALGQAMRIQGTPALLLEDGEMLPGYVPAAQLRQALEQRAAGGG
ncbi:MAG: DsbC family protein [Gammaproteobacteria bacterium]|nr:DsbC family protein [Gammaproteobacteria bacterium]